MICYIIIVIDQKMYLHKQHKEGDVKRNFFAHSGLESTLCKVYKRNDKIIIKYDEDRIEEIKEWLRDPS